MTAVRHRRPETRARRVTAALAGPSAVVCAFVVLIAWVSQGRPGPSSWVAAPPAAVAAPRATALPSPLPSPSARPTPSRSPVAAVKVHPSTTRHASPRTVARRTAKPAHTKSTPGKAKPVVGGLVGSILGLLGRILGHGQGGHRPGRR
jgi:hypothetical protein